MANLLNRTSSGSRSLIPRESASPFFGGGALRPFALLREMTDWMDQAFTGDIPALSGQRQWMPAVEVREKDNALVIDAELPGIDQKDVKVEVQDHSIVIQGERKEESSEEREGFRRSERSYGMFYRAIPLPENAHPEQAKADFKNGVLEITVPMEQSKSERRQIPVNASK
jgi:HSP20 family protein